MKDGGRFYSSGIVEGAGAGAADRAGKPRRWRAAAALLVLPLEHDRLFTH